MPRTAVWKYPLTSANDNENSARRWPKNPLAACTRMNAANACASLSANVVELFIEKSSRFASGPNTPAGTNTANDSARTSGLESGLIVDAALANRAVTG
jgi:hypothetical protein